MKASSLSFQAAVLFVVAGMIWGIVMAVTDDHSAFPAHAHLNLLGWVSLFLIGIYYRLKPSLERDKRALDRTRRRISRHRSLAGGIDRDDQAN
jgi:hypothetical protein